MSGNDWRLIAEHPVPIDTEVLIAVPNEDGTRTIFMDEVDIHGEWQITEGEATHWQPKPDPPSSGAERSAKH